MTDRELLEKAAKAAGLYEQWPAPDYSVHVEDGGAWCSGMGEGLAWNPLTDDGDALRLAVKLRLNIAFNAEIFNEKAWEFVEAFPEPYENGVSPCPSEPIGGDRYAATRRAIVRAAAAIGETK